MNNSSFAIEVIAIGLSLTAVLGTPALGTPQAIDFVDATYFGEEQCSTIARDAEDAFVAEGATISVLSLDTVGGTVTRTSQQEVDLKMIDLAFNDSANPDHSRLYIAAATKGLWRMCICGTASSRACVPGSLVLIDNPPGLVCNALDIVTGAPYGGGTLLLALFSGRNISELWVYELSSGSQALIGTVALPTDIPTPPAPDGWVAYAVEGDTENIEAEIPGSDPVESQESRFAYVAYGTGGILRVNITDPTAMAVNEGPRQLSSPYSEDRLRDVALARADNSAFVFVSSSWGHIYEIDISDAATWGPYDAYNDYYNTSAVDFPCEVGNAKQGAHRIAATAITIDDECGTDPQLAGDYYLVAVGTSSHRVPIADHGAPRAPLGRWNFDLSLAYPEKPSAPEDPPSPSVCGESMVYFAVGKAQSSHSTANLEIEENAIKPPGPIDDAGEWRSLGMVPLPGQDRSFLAMECTISILEFRKLVDWPCSTRTVALMDGFESLTNAAVDPLVTLSDPDVLWFGEDRLGDTTALGQWHIDSDVSGEQFVLTENSGDICSIGITYCDDSNRRLEPFNAGSLGASQWIEGGAEWFVSGRNTIYERIEVDNCLQTGFSVLGPCLNDECTQSPPSSEEVWREYESSSASPAYLSKGGWMISTFDPSMAPAAGGFDNVSYRWWQLPLNDQASPCNASRTTYAHAIADDRVVSGRPIYQFLLRSAALDGVRVLPTDSAMSAIAGLSCSSPNEGNGSILAIADADFINLRTSIEFANCAEAQAAGRRDDVYAHRAAQFSMEICGQAREILAVATGYVSNASPLSDWGAYFGYPKIVFFDVTADHTASWPPASGSGAFPLIKVGMIRSTPASGAPADPESPNPTPAEPGYAGHAIAIADHTYTAGPYAGDTFVFVADLTGRVLAFRCTEDIFAVECDPEEYEDPTDPETSLAPHSVWPNPGDPTERFFGAFDYDGLSTNFLDLDIDYPYAYVAATREGMLVLDITDPSNIVEAPAAAAADLRTPGFASGVTVRRVNNETTVIVGDNRGGLRLYKEPE